MSVKVLVVEDKESFHDLWRMEFGDQVELLSALTIKEAQELFRAHQDIAVIAMDACVPGDRPNTMFLVQEMRLTYTGPIIAISSLVEYRQMLVKAGCDFECEKDFLPQKIREILGL